MITTRPPCIDCGEPDPGGERCCECDLEIVFAACSCRECGRYIMAEEYGRDLAKQHVPGCSLATSDGWNPRTDEEIAHTRRLREEMR